jgi:uncharacterized protein
VPIFYLESSALVKRYLPEKGTAVMDDLLDGQVDAEFLVISILASLELKSVFARLAKGNRLTQDEFGQLLASFWADRSKFSTILPFDNAMVEEASGHLDRHAVRTLDVVHLASILRVRETAQRAGQRLIVVASDQDLLQACRVEKVDVFDPTLDTAG